MIKEAIVKIVNKEDLTYDEAYAWANEQVKLEGSPWYGYYMEIGQPFDGNYANAGDGTTPWTVDFFK